MADRPNARFPWLLIAASVLLVLVILYVLFVGYLPAKQRIAGLEAELKDLYRREADLQTKIAQQDQRYSVRERQLSALTSERDTLIRRLEELERLLGRTPTPRR
jgi:Tfp pilus assembly protein PilN